MADLSRIVSQAVVQEKEGTVPRKTKSEEIDELVDDLDDLDEVDLEEVEVDDDPDEAPAKKTRSRKKKADKPEKTGIGTREVADAAGIEPRQLRMFLRAAGYQGKDDREGRYNWASLNDPEVKEILKKIKAGEVDKLNKEKVAELKEKAPRGRKKATADAEA